jgi:hypothetical protein
VSLHDPAQGPLLRYEISPNLKTLGPKFGEQVKQIRPALAALDSNSLAAKVQAGDRIELGCAGTMVVLDANDILLKAKAPDGWTGLIDRGTQLLLDVRINEELAQEGMAREVVRSCGKSRAWKWKIASFCILRRSLRRCGGPLRVTTPIFLQKH